MCRYETAQESWEIFARELLLRFEMFWRFSYGLQQYTRAKKRTAVYRTRMEQLLAERDAHIKELEDELARYQGTREEACDCDCWWWRALTETPLVALT